MKHLICFFLMIGCGTTSAMSDGPRGTSPQTLTPMTQTLNPFRGEQLLEPDFRKREEREARLSRLPRLPSIEEVGFVDRPPRGWISGSPRSHKIANDTKFAVRVFLDGKELTQVTAGAVVPSPVQAAGIIRPMPLLPPMATLYHIGDAGMHALTIELYDGPAPLLYVKTCRIDINFMLQPTIYLAYRPCYKTNPSP